jgi:hypothetical protein
VNKAKAELKGVVWLVVDRERTAKHYRCGSVSRQRGHAEIKDAKNGIVEQSY